MLNNYYETKRRKQDPQEELWPEDGRRDSTETSL